MPIGVVLLIHGYLAGSPPPTFDEARLELESAGYVVYTPHVSDSAWSAPYQIRDAVNLAKAETGFSKVHIWGFSLGGVSALYYDKVLVGHPNVESLVMIDSPLFDPTVVWPFGNAYMNSLHSGDDTPGAHLYKQLIATPYTNPTYSIRLDGGVCAVEIPGVHTEIAGTVEGQAELAKALLGIC